MSSKEQDPKGPIERPDATRWDEFMAMIEKPRLPAPAPGDEIYIPDPLISFVRRMKTGGRAIVTAADAYTKDSGDVVHMIRTVQFPEDGYLWEGFLDGMQDELRERFGDEWAHHRPRPQSTD